MEEIKRISDLVPKGIYPNAQRVKFSDLKGREIIIKDATFIKNKYNKDAVVILFNFENDGNDYSTITSGSVIIKKVRYLVENQLLPSRGTVVKDKHYYDFN
jgi:hypothetical protein